MSTEQTVENVEVVMACPSGHVLPGFKQEWMPQDYEIVTVKWRASRDPRDRESFRVSATLPTARHRSTGHTLPWPTPVGGTTTTPPPAWVPLPPAWFIDTLARGTADALRRWLDATPQEEQR